MHKVGQSGTRSARAKLLLKLLLAVFGGGACSWAAWYTLVLKAAQRRLQPWGPRWLAIGLSSALSRFARWYLTVSDNAEDALKRGLWGPGKQYVMVWHPHGLFTLASLCIVSNWWARNYPGGTAGDRYVCVAPLLLRIPFLAEFLLLCHARSQDRETFKALLATGATVAVQPGGIAEQVATDNSQENVYFPANLGFVRLAIEAGVPLLPVYAFGENQLYNTNSFIRKLNTWVHKTLGAGTLVVQGLAGIPGSPLLPTPGLLPVAGAGLHIRFGNPVDVGQPDPKPSEAKVLGVFNAYVAALRQLFEEHKACLPAGVQERGLRVVHRMQAKL